MKTKSLLAIALLFCAAATASAEPKVGDMAPDFSLPGTDGKTHKLSDFRDKQVVVVAWFPKAKTKGCTAECKSFRADGAKLRNYDVAYFTASCDTPELNKEFATELNLDYPILSDTDKKVAKEYGVLRPDGSVAQRWTYIIGKDGKILSIDKEVKTADHATDVAIKLEELKVAKKK